jgi:hypothetical protein
VVPDQPLEDLFPDTVGGNTLSIESAQGESVRSLLGDDPTAFNEFLTSLGTSIDQVSAAFSFNLWPGATQGELTGLTISAVRVRNIPAATVAQNLVGLVQEDVDNAQVSQSTVAGKPVTAITNPENAEESVYLYPVGDVTFIVGGTPAHVEEAFSKLP